MALVIICLGISISSQAQRGGQLSGRVLDAQTGKPVPFASVFLANTMIGVISMEDGSYRLSNIPPGKYDITTSSVGYEVGKKSLSIDSAGVVLDVLIEPLTTVLKEVDIRSNSAEYRKQVKLFKKYFLGETSNASKCTIQNLDDITFNSVGKVLTATSDKPIEVENRAMGYRLLYFLQEFKIDFDQQYAEVLGTPWFEELPVQKESQRRRWHKERERAYYGSMNHFMRSLRGNALRENKFSVFILDRIRLAQIAPLPRPEYAYSKDSIFEYYPTNEEEILRKGRVTALQLKIEYSGEPTEAYYPGNQGGLRGTVVSQSTQISIFKFRSPGLVIHPNGYYENPLNYLLEGYLAWSEKASDALPLEYQPEPKRK